MATGPALLALCCGALYVLCMADVTCGQCVAKFHFYGVNHTTTTTNASTNNLTSTTTTSDITLIIQEGSGLVIEFSVVTENCFNDAENPRDFVIAISKEDQNKGESRNVDFCKIRDFADGTCYLWQSKECGCVKDGMKVNYFIKRKFWDSTDEAKWHLKATSQSRNLETNAVINIKLGYPPEVIALRILSLNTTGEDSDEVHSEPLDPGLPFVVGCNYVEGKPPVPGGSLRIVHNTEEVAGGKLLVPRQRGEGPEGSWRAAVKEFRHVFKEGVTCDDAANVSCQVAGASRNITSPLLVKCPPRILDKHGLPVVGKLSQPLDVAFRVYSHTANFTACTITSKVLGSKQSPGVKARSWGQSKVLGSKQGPPDHTEWEGDEEKVVNCSEPGRTISVVGKPPNLTLKLMFQSLTATDKGEKMLTISNDAGFDNITFRLRLKHTKDDVETNNDAEDGADAGDDVRKVALIVGIVIGAVLILSAIIVIVVSVKRNNSRRSNATNADLDYLYPILHPPAQLPAGGAIGSREDCGSLYDDDNDYFHAMGPCPPPPSWPTVCAEDDGEDNDTTPADAYYLHPVASSFTPLPAAGAESMDESPLPSPHPSTTEDVDVDQHTGHIYLVPQPQKTSRQPNDKLPEPPPP